MAGFIVGVLALVGVIALIVVGGFCFAVWLNEQVGGQPTEDDHDPYVDALATAARISSRGYEAERLIHTLAQQTRHGQDDPS